MQLKQMVDTVDIEDPELARSVSEHRAALRARMAPSQVVTRAGTMLRMVKQGLNDMAQVHEDRILLGFLGVVAFGRSMTLVMQNLRTHGREEFDAWYSPWQREMQGDPLMRYFNDLRTMVIHHNAPAIGISSTDTNGPPIGSITIDDLPLPEAHLGHSLDDTSMKTLCRLYFEYLECMFEAFVPVAFKVQDRILAADKHQEHGRLDGAA